ncbi:DUF882 domain-containing protein [Azospirillum sp.]|uniref:DUF882 domain-containing protein n=1 Tax=Azospirillum sp. TaxID=34012 RepID=UPI003D75F393
MADEGALSNPAMTIGRRELLRFGFAAAAAATVLHPEESHALMKAPPRQLTFVNLHTGEQVRAAYWAQGRYLREGMREINRLMRDHRNGAVHPIDPRLMDVLFHLQHRVGARGPIQVVSGYRSPQTNALLQESDPDGVATHSYHMEGKAVDIRLPGMPLRTLHKAALSLRAGGVGYYPSSNFVHVDVGPLRRW